MVLDHSALGLMESHTELIVHLILGLLQVSIERMVTKVFHHEVICWGCHIVIHEWILVSISIKVIVVVDDAVTLTHRFDRLKERIHIGRVLLLRYLFIGLIFSNLFWLLLLLFVTLLSLLLIHHGILLVRFLWSCLYGISIKLNSYLFLSLPFLQKNLLLSDLFLFSFDLLGRFLWYLWLWGQVIQLYIDLNAWVIFHGDSFGSNLLLFILFSLWFALHTWLLAYSFFVLSRLLAVFVQLSAFLQLQKRKSNHILLLFVDLGLDLLTEHMNIWGHESVRLLFSRYSIRQLCRVPRLPLDLHTLVELLSKRLHCIELREALLILLICYLLDRAYR